MTANAIPWTRRIAAAATLCSVAALGGVIIPAMVKVGYKPATAAALMATAGGIGVIIPPSISFVIYGSVTGISI